VETWHLMTRMRTRFTQRRLLARFRWAALLMLLPLLALAGVSGAGLVAINNASGALDRAEQLNARITVLNEHVQAVSLASSDVLVGGGTSDLAALTAAEKQVNADLAALSKAPDLTADQANAFPSVDDAWGATLPYRDAARRLGGSRVVDPSAVAGLEDFLLADLNAVGSRLASMEAGGGSDVAALRQNRDSAIRASAIALMIALVLGLAIAAWSSRRLAISVVHPLAVLKMAAARLAAGDLRHRVGSGSGDEIGELGDAFDAMAGQLEQERDAVRGRERRLAALVENASDGILVIEADGRIAFATPAFGEYVGSDGVTASRLSELVHTDDAARVNAAWTRASAGAEGSTLEVEARLHHREGTWRHTWVKLTNRFGDPAVAGMVLNVNDVSERHEHEQQLTFQALHDALTGLANRELFRQRLERSATTGGQRSNSVVYLDFDDFKRINDSQGHQVGDDFLVAMAERIVAVVRPDDTVARLGGDEYAILMEGTDSRAAVVATKRVLAALQQPLTLAGKEIAPRASVGIATSPVGTTSLDTLLADADLAMYFAKRDGKANFRVFSASMRTDLLDRLQLGEDLREAVASGGIEVQYQPIVDMTSGSIVGAEALARWPHPSRGWVGPATFIPLAEELNLAERIDAYVLHQACTQGRAWADAGLPALRMAVNLSGSNLDKPGLVATVARTLEETGFPADSLELELTEGVAIADSVIALTTLESLKALGVHLAIDDFGTGYSALSRLRALPFDTLKVDKVFVDELGTAAPGSTLADSILDMARVLGLKVVAEGVETASQADFLRARGCDFAQGYLFSRAVDSSAFKALLASGHALQTQPAEPAIAG
jgi:diguanylate cyclase (GGDEF)-like protein/PAS domain S-box-containing protein